jgi:hypothetical protein
VWALFFIFGGAVGLTSVLARWRPMEAVALLSFGGAVTTFIVALLFSQPLREQDGVNFGLVGVLTITLLLMILRATVLHHQIKIRTDNSEGDRHVGQ